MRQCTVVKMTSKNVVSSCSHVGGLALFQVALQLLSPPVTVAFYLVDSALTRWMCSTLDGKAKANLLLRAV